MQKRGFSRFLMLFTGVVILFNIFSATYISLQVPIHASGNDYRLEEKITVAQHTSPIQLEDAEEKTVETIDGEDEEQLHADVSCTAFFSSGAEVFYALSGLSNLPGIEERLAYPSRYILFENFRL